MLYWLRRNLPFLNAVLSASASVPLAIWINLFTSTERPKWFGSGMLLDFLLPSMTLILLIAQYYIVRRIGGVSQETVAGIGGALRFGVEILAARSNIDDWQVRGHCHYYENGKLVPLAYFSRGFQKDSSIEIPTSDNWFVITRAFNNNEICCRNSDWSQPSALSKEVWKDVKGILACPIKPLPDPANPVSNQVAPIGVISFDASRNCEQMNWSKRRGGINPEIYEAMTALAATAYILIMKDLSNERN